MLERAGVVTKVADHVTPWAAQREHTRRGGVGPTRGQCATYEVKLLGPVVLRHELPVPLERLDAACAVAPDRHGRATAVDEMLHAVWAPRVEHLMHGLYDRRQRERLAELTAALRRVAGAHGDGPTSRAA